MEAPDRSAARAQVRSARVDGAGGAGHAGLVPRQIGESEAIYYSWKKRFGDLGVTELKRRSTPFSGR